jgi:hypothetical protein
MNMSTAAGENLPSAAKAAPEQTVSYARLKRLLKKSFHGRFVSGHDFSRADKPFISRPSRLQPAAQNRRIRVFQQPVQSCRYEPH